MERPGRADSREIIISDLRQEISCCSQQQSDAYKHPFSGGKLLIKPEADRQDKSGITHNRNGETDHFVSARELIIILSLGVNIAYELHH